MVVCDASYFALAHLSSPVVRGQGHTIASQHSSEASETAPRSVCCGQPYMPAACRQLAVICYAKTALRTAFFQEAGVSDFQGLIHCGLLLPASQEDMKLPCTVLQLT